MPDKNAEKPRREEEEKAEERVKDLERKPVDETDAQQVKGGLGNLKGFKY